MIILNYKGESQNEFQMLFLKKKLGKVTIILKLVSECTVVIYLKLKKQSATFNMFTLEE